jgi:hypothetical protein
LTDKYRKAVFLSGLPIAKAGEPIPQSAGNSKQLHTGNPMGFVQNKPEHRPAERRMLPFLKN